MRVCQPRLRQQLGRLENTEIKGYWENEARDFTPWLADEQNIGLLGETIRLELEVRSQEQSVGPFRADIVCVDTVSGRTVLIENQLERTDHSHLGQLLTYAAGLDAIVIVWIAQRFTDEHRAAVDWLNRITDDSVSFFGLEIELWRIGNSPPAPKFNMVAKPNEWTKPLPQPGLTDTQRLYREYWTALREHLEASRSSIRMGKPQPQTWMTFPVGRNYFYLTAAISKTKKSIAIYLVIYGSDRLAHFHLLQRQESKIKERLGPDLEANCRSTTPISSTSISPSTWGRRTTDRTVLVRIHAGRSKDERNNAAWTPREYGDQGVLGE